MTHSAANRNLLLATVGFAIAFALWGLLSGLAPIFKARYGLTATQTSLMVAIPVLLGSLGRIPMGVLTDRFGGRVVFSCILLFGLVPTLALAADHSYLSLLLWGFWLGLMGATFSVGAGHVSRWYPPERQGTALGIYGVGNIGQTAALVAGPLLAKLAGMAVTFRAFGLVSFACGLVFALRASDAPRVAAPMTLGGGFRLLGEPTAWVLSLFYFQTFGGFVALGIALPTLLRDVFKLTVEDAGLRAAGFVVLATLCRPLGGWIADRWGGERLLRVVFVGLTACAWFMVFGHIVPFTVGALGSAALLGLGNGGVFKLVPRRFPQQTATASGLVGAAGGLGGFFPPIVLGLFRDHTGSYAPGFMLLSVFAAGCASVVWRASAFRQAPTALPQGEEVAPVRAAE